jgi:hypothetical protein
MGWLDAILQRAPGIAAQGLAGKRAGQDRLRQQEIEDEKRQRDIQQAALQKMILEGTFARQNAAETREAELSPYRKRLLAAQAADEEAAAAGTGRYALKPDQSPGFHLVEEEGRQVAVDDQGRPIGKPFGAKPKTPPQPVIVSGVVDGQPGIYRVPKAGGTASAVSGPGGTALAPVSGQPTESQDKAAAYFRRGTDALTNLNALEAHGYAAGTGVTLLAGGARKGGLIGMASRAPLSGPDKQFLQASQQFVNAINRRDSGAAIAESEWEDALSRYLPVQGDSPELLEQKRRSRQIELESLKAGSGRVLNRPGATPAGAEPDDADTIADAWLKAREEKKKKPE